MFIKQHLLNNKLSNSTSDKLYVLTKSSKNNNFLKDSLFIKF